MSNASTCASRPLPGVVGWGESFGTARPMVIAAFDNWIRRLAVGQSATDGKLVPRLERMLLSMSRAGPMLNALAGLDIALWDIRGKREGVPVSTLLGGAKRTHVECYASLLQYYGNAEHLKRNTARALERGYKHIKLHERTPEAVAIARDAVGAGIPLMVDTNCAWTPAEAEAAVTAMAPSKPFWVEEPIYPPEDLGSARTIADGDRHSHGRGGEHEQPDRLLQHGHHRQGRLRAAESRQDRHHAMARVAAEVERLGAICTPNAFYLGPAYLAALHCVAAKEKASPLERMFADFGSTPFAKTVPVIDGGIEVPRGPGLGADPEDELIAQFRV